MTSNWTTGQHETAHTYPPEGCLTLGADTGGFVPWNNPDNILSHATERAVDTAVGAVCLPILFLISAPTNILNMLVFCRQGLKERINLCLFYLSLVDFFHMFHAFLCNVDRFYLPFNTGVSSGYVFRFLIDHSLLGARSLTWLSGFVSMMIACDRCVCVVNPLRSQTVMSAGKTGVVLAVATAVCFTGSVFSGMRWSLVCVLDPETNATSSALRTSEFFARNQAHLNVLQLFSATIQPIINVAVITVTTVVTSVKLSDVVAWRAESSSSSSRSVLSSKEVTLTRMLIAASVLYIVCSLPTSMLGISVLFVPGVSLEGRYYNFGMVLVSCFHLASYVNGTFNFFLYVSLGSRYRSTLRSLFCASDKLQ